MALPTGDGPVIQLTWGLSGQNDREPCWSDDSSRIAFLRSFAEGDASGDHVWTVSITTGETKQATKKVANRQGLRWNPGKTQVGFITDEGEWLNVGVVNPDNSAGWNLASEAGDKGDPRYTADGARMLYTRGLKGEVRLGERATSGASAELLDPGMGVASHRGGCRASGLSTDSRQRQAIPTLLSRMPKRMRNALFCQHRSTGMPAVR